MATRRDFLAGAAAAALPRLITTGIGGPAPAAESPPPEEDWDHGAVQHLIPTASHDRFLIKASFTDPQVAAPELEIGNRRMRGQQNAAAGDFWQFDVTGLLPATNYRLSLTSAGGNAVRAMATCDLSRAGRIAGAAAADDLYLRRRA